MCLFTRLLGVYLKITSSASMFDWRRVVADLLVYWRSLVLVIAPLLFLPLVLVNEKEAKCAFVVLLMAVYWLCEVAPLAVTAFLPLFLFPMVGIMSAKDVAPNYLKDSNFVFVGSLMMAVAVEESNLHQRIALRILLVMGSNVRLLMLGFQMATAFLSMWMSNTATTAMVVPIAMAVIEQLELFRSAKSSPLRKSYETFEMDTEPIPTGQNLNFNLVPTAERNVYKALLLAICYSANIGGTGTLTGTGTNIVLSGQLDNLYPSQTDINFASWMAFAVPQMIVLLFCSWIILQLMFFGFKKHSHRSSDINMQVVIQQKYQELGPMKYVRVHACSSVLKLGYHISCDHSSGILFDGLNLSNKR